MSKVRKHAHDDKCLLLLYTIIDDIMKIDDMTKLPKPQNLDWNEVLQRAIPDSHKWLESHPSFSWSLIISLLHRANETEAVGHFLSNVHVKGKECL